MPNSAKQICARLATSQLRVMKIILPADMFRHHWFHGDTCCSWSAVRTYELVSLWSLLLRSFRVCAQVGGLDASKGRLPSLRDKIGESIRLPVDHRLVSYWIVQSPERWLTALLSTHAPFSIFLVTLTITQTSCIWYQSVLGCGVSRYMQPPLKLHICWQLSSDTILWLHHHPSGRDTIVLVSQRYLRSCASVLCMQIHGPRRTSSNYICCLCLSDARCMFSSLLSLMLTEASSSCAAAVSIFGNKTS